MKHLFIAAALALVSLPSFADNGKPFAFGEPAEAAKATRTIEVVLKDIAFEPKSIKVKAGETVRFVVVNEGKLPHEFNLGDKAMHAEHQKEMIAMQGKMFTAGMNHEGMEHGQMDHGQMGAGHGHAGGNTVLVQPGQRAELTWTFRKSAPIEFACNVPGHYQAGMVGPLTIE
ncbi:cupredoxin family protein [Pseudomonas mosselii]|uniref:cupredoxin domain-containing protein n=1 Tax=Pseudomonas mosselii TaxID=78327 RepID=UPI00244C0FBD|nr:cupredoxin family protein [Pseudomonas mosselii]MDH0626462.1 cupredoxin family protein [Pseudomonas mosselii]MDH0676064.1 cupredoxin family protein [Pseudomonas mosselii]MDH0925154.1 cupredoxin family protein [Pseudomonas mosselii]MDH1133323.1 cupredoxin family protein [Pseudomonas mosselii]MDH1137971.1 cupredoxin family protein [Pseudomonas mosselii]